MKSKGTTRIELEREILWRRCKADPWFFISNYIKTLVVGKGYQFLDPRDYQKNIVDWMHTKHIDEPSRGGALKARQLGWTTLANAFALWSMFFFEYKEWLQVSVGEDESQKAIEQKLAAPYAHLPLWMKQRGPKVIVENKQEFNFDNGSSMLAIPSTSRSGRSRAMFGCIFDEAAFMMDAGDVFAGIEPMIYGPLFLFSTANGMGNFFHETWVESLADDSLWDMHFYPWNVVPERDEEWYKTKKLMYRGKEHLFYQEYPANPGEAFMRSGRTAFDIEYLEETQPWEEPLYRLDCTLLEFHKMHDDRIELSKIPVGEVRDIELHVWVEPTVERDKDGLVEREPNYGIGLDVSEGLVHGDYSAISVRDINRGEQVATMRAHAPIYDLGSIVETVGYWYHTALIGVERNNFGLVPLQYLQNAGYPRLYRMEPIAEMKRGNRTARYGWLTSRTTKPKMVQDMALAVSVETVVLHDRRWLQEATTFVSTGTGRYEASSTNTDDLMMAELIAHQMELDIGRFPILWKDPTPGPLTFGEVFAIMSYDEKDDSSADALNRPIGQPYLGSERRRSFPMRYKSE